MTNNNNEFMDIFSEFMKNQSGSTVDFINADAIVDDKENNDTEDKEETVIDYNKEYDLLYDKYIRLMAEYDNYRKRTLKEKEEIRNTGYQKSINAIIPIVDDFERALVNVHEDAKEGVNLIYNKFISTLETLGVEKINVENNITEFDTDIHDAVTMINVKKKKLDKKIVDCVQTGYKLNGKIIRHPKVIVGKYDK